VVREAHEEAGVLIDPADLAFSHAVHHRNPEGQPRIGRDISPERPPARNGGWRNMRQ
jgi:8-oxo-dGTP diphosphatase